MIGVIDVMRPTGICIRSRWRGIVVYRIAQGSLCWIRHMRYAI